MLLAHGGTQQFFFQQHLNKVVLRNMIAREILKGNYKWSWSLTTGSSFTPAESFRFAEAFWGAIVQVSKGQPSLSPSLVSVNDPAVVVFRYGADSGRLTVWLMNYSGEGRQAELSFAATLRSCRRVNLEGNPMTGDSARLDGSGKTVKLSLSPWEIAALDLQCK